MLDVVIVVGGVVVVPGLEIRAVGVLIIGGVGDVIGGIVVEEVFQADVGLVVIGSRVIGGVVDGIKGVVVAVDDVGVGGISTTIIVGHVAVLVLRTARAGGIVVAGGIGGVRRRRGPCRRATRVICLKKPVKPI